LFPKVWDVKRLTFELSRRTDDSVRISVKFLHQFLTSFHFFSFSLANRCASWDSATAAGPSTLNGSTSTKSPFTNVNVMALSGSPEQGHFCLKASTSFRVTRTII